MKNNKFNVAVYSINWLSVSETFIFRQIKGLDDHGYDSIILTESFKESKLLDSDRKRLIYCQHMSKTSFIKSSFLRKVNIGHNLYSCSAHQSRFWHGRLIENGISLLHAHYGTGGLRVLDLAKKNQIPLVTTFHGNDASVMIRKKSYLNSLKYLFEYSYIITVSEFMRRRLVALGAKEKRVVCLYIGTDLNKFKFTEHISVKQKAKNKLKITFLQVSNFVEKKGHKYTIHAFSKFLKTYENAELLLGGDGIEMKDCQQLVKTLGLSSKVIFLGAINPDQVADLMKKSDVFLHHSITGSDGSEEGIPTVLMEAMASGIPVVSSFHAGIPELIIDRRCGFLVKEKDIDSYAKILISLLDTETYSMAAEAKEHVYKFFDIEKQNLKLIDFYSKVLSR